MRKRLQPMSEENAIGYAVMAFQKKPLTIADFKILNKLYKAYRKDGWNMSLKKANAIINELREPKRN